MTNKIKLKMYLHSGKESNIDIGEGLGLSEKALGVFKNALYEVEFDTIVDIDTGECVITHCDGKGLVNEKTHN